MPVPSPGPDEIRAELYRDFRNERTYETQTGTLILPTADGVPIKISVFKPYVVQRVSYAASKLGEPPVVPKPAATDKVISHTHIMPLPTPFQSGYGSGFVYTVAGAFEIIDAFASSPDVGYDFPRTPYRIEPMDSEAAAAGYPTGFETQLQTFLPADVVLSNPDYVFPSAMVMPSAFFSDKI